MGRPPGKTKTFPRVVKLLTAAVKEKGQKMVEAETKLSQSMISRYLKGEGEPSQATLEKLAASFGVTVVWLRGENEPVHKKIMKLVKDLESGKLSQNGQNEYEAFNKEIDLLRNEVNLEYQNELEIAAPLIDVMQTQISPSQWEDAANGLRFWLDKKMGKIKD